LIGGGTLTNYTSAIKTGAHDTATVTATNGIEAGHHVRIKDVVWGSWTVV